MKIKNPFQALKEFLQSPKKVVKSICVIATQYSFNVSRKGTKRTRKNILELLASETDAGSFTKKLANRFGA